MTDTLLTSDSMKLPAFRRVGFTLMEVLVSMSILLVLLILGMTSLSNMRRSSGNVRCVNNLRQLGLAITAYAGENNGVIPPGRDYTDGFKYWFSTSEMWALAYLGKPPGGKVFFRCPLDTFSWSHSNYYNYTWNVEFLQDWPLNKSNRNPEASKVYLRDAKHKVLMADGASDAERPPGDLNGSTGAPGPIPINLARAALTVSKRHNEGANCLLGDGSVQWYPHAEIISTARLHHWQ